MPDFDDDALRVALRDLSESAQVAVRPPGLDEVASVARRRQGAQTAGLAGLAVLLLIIAIAIPTLTSTPAPVETTPSPVPTVSRSGPPGPTPTPTPSVAPLSTPPGSPSATGPGGGSVAGSVAGSTACEPTGFVGYVQDLEASGGGTLVADFTASQICPDETIRMFWASYHIEYDGSRTLYDSVVRVLTPAESQVRLSITVPAQCPFVYVVSGDYAVRTTIPAGVQYGYPPYSAAQQGGAFNAQPPAAGCGGPPPSP
jgi:hypothetical protein